MLYYIYIQLQPPYKQRRINIKEPGTIALPEDCNKYYLNLTNIQISRAHEYIFFLCKKFCPTPTHANWSQFETDIDNWIYLLRWSYKLTKITIIPTADKNYTYEKALCKKSTRVPNSNSGCPALELYIELVKTSLLQNRTKQKVSSNLLPDHLKALEDMKQWENKHNIIFRPYDKGDGIVIDYKDSYKARVLKELNTDTYKEISNEKEMHTTITQKITEWANKWEGEKYMTKKLIQWIIPNEKNKPGRIYLNYKKHKPEKGYPGRIITSGSGSLTENLSALAALELKKRSHILPYILIDSNHLLRKLDAYNQSKDLLGKDIIHVSLDVIAMFPNITKDIGLKRCREELNLREDGLPTECIMEAIEITLDYNIGEFDGKWYLQLIGAAQGPHHSCDYCDIAMSHIDNIVHSNKNPIFSLETFLNWVRFRDDIYMPWTLGEEKLLKFFSWLNTLSEHLKFEIKYSREGVEYLETFIYDIDGVLHTKLFSKESDTHAYLPPTSCHPYHICKNNPSQVARRIRKINSEESEYIISRDKFKEYLKVRGYSTALIEESFNKFDNVDRKNLYLKSNKKDSDEKKFPLISEFNPHLPSVTPILNKYKYVLELDDALCKIIPPKQIFASYRQPKNIKDTLIHSRFESAPSSPKPSQKGCQRCNRKKCDLCDNFLIQTKIAKSYQCTQTFPINKLISCDSKGIIYIINDIICKKSYIGSTITDMRDRLSTYKNHIQTGHKGCEIALHFNENTSKHSLQQSSGSRPNLRSKPSTVRSNFHSSDLKSHINITLIDIVDLSDCQTRIEKRSKIERIEGHWQTELRTMQRYGGLNKKDERKIANNKTARYK